MNLVEQHLTSNSDLLKIIEPIRLENYGKERVYFGLGDYQGGRLIIQIVVYFSEIPTLVPIVNRPVNTDHVNEIKDYVLQRTQSNKAWILGSLTLNVNKNDIKYQSLGNRLYIVRIPNGTTMQIADGQHRIQVITELMASSKHRCLIADEQIPLTLILDVDPTQAKLDFRDMAQQEPIPGALLIPFNSEGRDAIACSLVQKVSLFRNSTEMIKASPNTGTKNIYTGHYIAVLVACAIAGNADAELLEYNTSQKIETAAVKLSAWLNKFFSSCPVTKELVKKEELTVVEVAQFRNNSILALSIGLEILGHLIHRSNFTPHLLATQINWSRTSDWWNNLIIVNNSNRDKVRVKAAGAQETFEVAQLAISRLKKE